MTDWINLAPSPSIRYNRYHTDSPSSSLAQQHPTTMASTQSSNEGSDDGAGSWFDKIVTPLNACSLETFVPIPIPSTKGAIYDETVDADVLPLVIGCYQLNESTPEANDASSASASAQDDNIDSNATKADDDDAAVGTKASRSGELRLYMITNSRDDDFDASSTNVGQKFGEPSCVIKMESGVLDGKWKRRDTVNISNDSSSFEGNPIFASACASGRIHLHSLEQQQQDTDAATNNTELPSWNLSLAATSDVPESVNNTNLCLALAWNDFIDSNDSSSDGDQIVSSYSDGTVALHQVSYNNTTNDVSIEESHRWKAHSMFGCPSEVWTCSFLRGDENVVLSGADDVSFVFTAMYGTSLLCRNDNSALLISYHGLYGWNNMNSVFHENMGPSSNSKTNTQSWRP